MAGLLHLMPVAVITLFTFEINLPNYHSGPHNS